MSNRLILIFSFFALIQLTSCTKDKDAPVVDYFWVNGQPVSLFNEAEKEDILQLKISITDEGGLSTHSLRYLINSQFGDELIYISDEIVNTIVEEFYLDLRQLSINNVSYACKSGDLIEFDLQAEDLNGNILDQIFQIQIK